jgi:uncharacterized protein YifN (PemK superfamily)
MKKFIPAGIGLFIFVTAFSLTEAQEINDKKALAQVKNEIPNRIVDPIPETKDTRSVLYKINLKALRDFMLAYPTVTNEKWEILKDGFMVSFTLNAIWTKNYYDKKGRWLHCIQQYEEFKLLKDIRDSIKSIYYDYKIVTVKEINTQRSNDEAIYFVYLKNGDDYKIVRVYNGEFEEMAFSAQ